MMKKLLLITSFLFVAFTSNAQQVFFQQYIQGTGGQVTDTLDNGTIVTLDLSTDDAEQQNDEVDGAYDDDLDAGWEGAPEDQNLLTLGLRFVNITVPFGAVIDSAFVVLHAHEGKSAEDVCILTIVGEDTDNALTFDEDHFDETMLITDRPRTNAESVWTIAEDWTIWQPYQSTDIGAVIQEIVNREGWVSGNAIALFLLPENQGPSVVENAREFTSYENIADPDDVDPEGNPGDGSNHPERRPILKIYYQGTVGIIELQADLFQVYPNPVGNDLVHIQLIEAGPASLQVINITGQQVMMQQINSQKSTLNVSELAKGIYFLKLSQNGVTTVKKLIVE